MPENRVGAASELPEYAAKKIDSPLLFPASWMIHVGKRPLQ